MEFLRMTYGTDSEDDAEDEGLGPSLLQPSLSICRGSELRASGLLPPPQLDLLQAPNALSHPSRSQVIRVRNFPHVEGNYALHVYIPVVIPYTAKKHVELFVKKIASLVPDLYVVDVDIALSELIKDDRMLEQIIFKREFHISLGRSVPIRVHQIDSILAMLRQKFHFQKRYLIDFDKWDIFVNDDQTRSFISLEVIGRGLSEITSQIHAVDEIYRLHGLPEFYEDPRPHISLLWALGDVSCMLKQAIEKLEKSPRNGDCSLPGRLLACKFGGIECKY